MPDDQAHSSLTPRLIVPDSAAAIDFYARAFGAVEQQRFTSPEGVVVHAEIRIGGSRVSLADEAKAWGNLSPAALGGSPLLLELETQDPDAVATRAAREGADIVVPVADQFYGHRAGRIRDPFGHLWILFKVLREMSTEDIQRGVSEFTADSGG